MTDDSILEEIYQYCPGGITIEPHNPNIPGSNVRLMAQASIKHANGEYQYAKLYICRKTLTETLEAARHMISGYKSLVESAP